MPDSTADTVNALFDAFARRDLEAAVELVTEDFELHPQPTAERAGRSEPYRGHAGLAEFRDDIGAVWDDITVEPGDLRIAANGVVAFGTLRGIANGAEHVVPVIWVFKLRDGRAQSIRVVQTAAQAQSALERQSAGE